MTDTPSPELEQETPAAEAAGGSSLGDALRTEIKASREQVAEPESPAAPPVNASAETAVQPAAAEAPVEEPWWKRELEPLGFSGVESEEDARQRLLEAYRAREGEVAQQRQLAEYGQQFLQLVRDPSYHQFLAAKQQGGAPPAEQKPVESNWWSPPEYQPAWLDKWREVKVDPATGEQVAAWKPDTPMEVRAKAEAYGDYIEQWKHRLVYEPDKVLPEIIEKIAGPLIEKRLQATSQKSEFEQVVNNLTAQHSDVLYELDPRTRQPAVDPLTGAARLSADGQKIIDSAQVLIDRGMNVREAMEIVAERVELARLRRQTNLRRSPEEIAAANDEKKRELLRRGAASQPASPPSRGGSFPESHVERQAPQNPGLSVGRQLLAELQATGQV